MSNTDSNYDENNHLETKEDSNISPEQWSSNEIIQMKDEPNEGR